MDSVGTIDKTPNHADVLPSKRSRVLIVTPSSEKAMHVSGGVAKVIRYQRYILYYVIIVNTEYPRALRGV